MEIGGYGYEKPELLSIAEKIYDCKSKKQDLELTLSSERFHYSYIPKRKNLVEHEVVFRLLFIIPFTLLVIGALCFVISYMSNLEVLRQDGTAGVVMLFAVLLLLVGGYLDGKLLLREFRMLALLFISRNPEQAMRFSKKYDINTFQSDEAKSKQRIQMLESEIASLDEQIDKLNIRQNQLLAEKEQREDVLRKKGILYDENPNKPKQEGKFTLKEDSTGTVDARELHEFYLKEEQYVQNYLLQLDGKLQNINKEITEIDENFDCVKKKILISLVIYILVALVQSALSGVLSTITSMICLIGGLCYVFYLESKCKRPILLYLVEHDSSLTTEYAFCKGIVPVKQKREELLEKIEHYQKELVEIRKKKEAIIF
ncbi:MAG: hypothetical protein ACI4A3_13150 [Lachnospiraceae bacterium]